MNRGNFLSKTTTNLNGFLEKIEDFSKLADKDQITVENNLHNLIGNFNIIIDSQLVNDEDFLEYLFKTMLNLDTNSSRIISEKLMNENEMLFTNYVSKETKFEYLNYKDITQPIKMIKKNFAQEINMLNNTSSEEDISNNISKSELLNFQKLESDKTLVLLSDMDNPQEVYNKFIEPVFNENVFIMVFGRDGFPSFVATKNKTNSQSLKYEFDKEEISALFDYLNIDDDLNKIYKSIDEDVKEKLRYTKNFDDLFSEFEKHINTVKENKEELIKLADEYKGDIQTVTRKYLDENMPLEKIVKTIDAQNIRKKKKEQKEFAERFLHEKIKSVNYAVEHKVNMFNNKTKDYINEIEADFIQVSGLKFGNNIGSWFASGLAGLGSYGALALYMSSLGNLGGYILVAKGVSLLAGFGIATGGTAAAFSTVSALGGPIGIAIGAGLATALLSKSLLGIGWKKSLAKQIRKTSENNVRPKLREMNIKLWKETKTAVSTGFDEIIKESRKDFIERNKDIITFKEVKKINEITNIVN